MKTNRPFQKSSRNYTKESNENSIYLLFGHTHGMCQFLGQGSNLCHSSNLSCHSDRQHGILNLLRHQGTTQEQLQPSFAVTKTNIFSLRSALFSDW